MFRNDTPNSTGQNVPDVAETLEAVTTKIIPEFTAKTGEEEKPQDLGGSYVQEPKPDPDFLDEKLGHSENWEVVHRPRIAFELTALPSPPATTEGETPPKIKPVRLTLDGAESVVKEIKFYLDEVELTSVKVEPLTGTGQEEGLWAVEVPRITRDLAILRIS